MSHLAILGGSPVRTAPFAHWPEYGDPERAALMEVLESGSWGGYSPKVAQFERAFAAMHAADFAVTASNGTVTLEGALRAAGVGEGDEVIVPPITFVATATAVIRVGAIPVFADIGKHLNLDPIRVCEAISPRTRAIIPVHFAGHPADMDALLPIARSHGLTVIEDAAHAHGGSWKGTPVGAIGDIGSFSFQQSKNMTAGEGGILVGNNEELIASARSFFSQGRLPGGGWYDHPNLGTNQRLTAWQAAILLAQLDRLPDQIARRSANAKYLDAQIAELDFIDAEPPDSRVTCHSYYLYPLRLRPQLLESVDSAAFTAAVDAEGIAGIGRYPRPLQENAVFRKYPTRVLDCPHAYQICQDMFWVSHEIMLGQKQDLNDFVEALSKVAAGSSELAARVG